jgi:hypothetical protein
MELNGSVLSAYRRCPWYLVERRATLLEVHELATAVLFGDYIRPTWEPATLKPLNWSPGGFMEAGAEAPDHASLHLGSGIGTTCARVS